jgi:DNA-binding CsgD family transcriptional regulator/tetratricopeptide (TPR) repeat protein
MSYDAAFAPHVEAALAGARAGRSIVFLAPPGAGLSTLLQRIVTTTNDAGVASSFARFPDPRFPDAAVAPGHVLVVDDAHRATDVQQLAIRDLAVAGPVVIGVRSGAALEGLSWLWRSGFADRVELEPLDATGIEAITEQRLGGPVHWTLVAGIMKRSGGRPGFAVDEIESRRSAGASTEAGFVRDRPSDGLGARLIERAEGILGELPDAVAEAVRIVAVAGTLPNDAVIQLGVDATALVRRGLAEPVTGEAGSAGVRLVPPALAPAVRATLPPAAAVALGQRILASAGEQLAAVDSARLRVSLGAPLELAEVAAAAWAAVTDRSLDDAATLARSAMAFGPAGTLIAAEVFVNVGDRVEAADCYERLLVDDGADDAQKARAATEYASTLLWDLGRADEAVGIAAALTAAAAGSPFADAAVLHEAAMLMYSGHATAAHALLQRVEPGALDEEGVRVWHLVRLVAASIVEPTMPSHDDIAAVTAVSDVRLGASFAPAVGVIAAELAYECAGAWAEAAAVVAEARGDLRHGGTALSAGWLALAESRAALAIGRLELAARAAAESAGCFADVNHPSGLRWATGAALLASAQMGDRAACVEHTARLEGLAAGAPFLDADLLRAQAWGDWAVGDSPRAAAGFTTAASLAATMSAPALEAAALHDAYRALRSPVAARLDELSRMHPAPSIELRGRHVRLVAAQQPTDLIGLAAEFADRGATLIAGEVAADAARIATMQGRRSTAREADRLRVRLIATCGTVATPAVAGLRSGELTNRERDVATRAAAGRPSKAIAHDLGLSVRTVDNVLQRVYAKLGIHGRAELPGLLAAPPGEQR